MPKNSWADDSAVIPWYPDDSVYDAFKRSAVDAEDFFADHQQWADAALQHERSTELHGVHVLRIVMALEPFLSWCNAHGKCNDAAARSLYAEHQANQLF